MDDRETDTELIECYECKKALNNEGFWVLKFENTKIPERILCEDCYDFLTNLPSTMQ